ncbi:MAG TPA: PQQ-dependent sugar dehydrogenase, partial [Cyclobacteriaceae bacterium]|nr:PQQ-dependent sugar dehydrogenase [Cyclobacteriaceae bacterium]
MRQVICYCLAILLLEGCKPKGGAENTSIATDSLSIVGGQLVFSQNCSACHNFKENGIGPQLGGLTEKVSPDWIKEFIRDPKAVMESGDARGKQLAELYHTTMPSFPSFSDKELGNIVAFLATRKAPNPRKEFLDPNALKNPIPDPIPMSDLVVKLEEVAQIPPSDTVSPFTRITKLAPQPRTGTLFVVDLRGKLYRLNGSKPEVYLDLTRLRPKTLYKPGHASGFGSFAFHPEFMKNGLLYTVHTERPGSGSPDFSFPDSIKVVTQGVVTEWRAKSPAGFPFEGESRELFRVNMPSQIHGIQEVTFNPMSKPGEDDYGMLYIGIGDGGSAENGFGFLCHNPEKIWGTVLRIDPRGTNAPNGHYGIPKDNPFAKTDNPNINREIFALGFRNPHRITWNKKGEMIVPNVGHHNIEALYLVKPGSDCGWPMREGSFVIDPSQNMHNIYPVPADDAKSNFTYPIAEYDHDEGDAIAG